MKRLRCWLRGHHVWGIWSQYVSHDRPPERHMWCECCGKGRITYP